ncbi:MAG: DUF559 domain-containing protein [Candidatus Pacearchaeota archaeon]|jgi:very-short-patch-repair endonuclease|nr:DUF559 domain-containing protein [Clostridia bacterium]
MKVLSNKTREKISVSMKKVHAEGRHPGWSKANRNNRSYPEKLFEGFLRNNGYYEKYSIQDQFPAYGFFLDFGLIDLKCDIEIDGIQHYRTAANIEYDNRRDNILIENGWIVYRIAAKDFLNNPDAEFKLFEEFINSNRSYRKYNIDDVLKEFKRHKYGNRNDYANAVFEQNKEKYKDIIEIIKKTDIDFKKFGWVSKIAVIINIKPQKVNRWMKRYMNAFYEENCYKRIH